MIKQLISVPDVALKQARVLLVDDQPLNLTLVSAILLDHHQVLTADSGEDAIAKALLYQPDLILMDVAMGEVSGIDACIQLKANEATEDTPVLFITSLEGENNEEECWRAGAVDFIPKPVSALTLINRVRVHLQLKFQSDAMKKLAFLDGLTGIFNRRYIDNQLVMGLKQRRRMSSAYSVLMIDIDYFKAYNDIEGHLKGDECLKKIASLIHGVASRPLDVVGRFGGEEFCVLLPETDRDGAESLARRLLEVINRQRMPHYGSSLGRVSVSIGLVSVTGIQSVTPEALLKAADVALYNAKSDGRACLRCTNLLN